MSGKIVRVIYIPVIKAGGIVCHHGGRIVRIVIVDQYHFFKLVFRNIQIVEDFHQILCNGAVAD